MKQIKFIAVALFLVVLGTMPAFAASQVAVSNPATVAYEILGTQRSVNVVSAAPGTQGVKVVLGNDLASGQTVNLTLTGGALFTTTNYTLCASSGGSITSATAIGNQAPVSNTTLNIPVNLTGTMATLDTGAGNSIWLVTVPSPYICTSTSALNLAVAASTPVSGLGMGGNITSGTATISTFVANNVIAVSRQYSTALQTGALVGIDYLAGSADGTTIAPDSYYSTNLVAGCNALALANTALSYNVSTVSAGFNQVLTLADSRGDWSGITRVYAVTGSDVANACTSGNIVATVAAPASGTIRLSVPNASNLTPTTGNTFLCVNVAGNVVLPSRNIFGSYSYELSAGSGLNVPPGFGSTTASVLQAWTPNAYQAFNPYMYVGTSQDTMDVFCRFYNSSTRTANVFVDVYPSSGGVSTRQTLAPISPNTAGTYWGSTIGAGASLTAGTSYAASFTITALPTEINGVSFFKRSSGDRQLPLYKRVVSGGQYLSE